MTRCIDCSIREEWTAQCLTCGAYLDTADTAKHDKFHDDLDRALGIDTRPTPVKERAPWTMGM